MNGLYNDRLALLKEYVAKYRDSPSGALLPNFCLLKDRLTKEDLLSMYNILSERMRKTELGQKILVKAQNRE